MHLCSRATRQNAPLDCSPYSHQKIRIIIDSLFWL
jgi:hypothetical protein